MSEDIGAGGRGPDCKGEASARPAGTPPIARDDISTTIEPPPAHPVGRASTGSAAEQVGDQIGPYRLVDVIGEGGFGVVFRAEQREPISRTVALKLIKPGMDSKSVIARFDAERQALALMDHPHIAKIFDGGVTQRGLPYFVMEYVRGEPITDYCDRHRLSVAERMQLFCQVCDAVHHAHQKGIIHRDLSPSNILVSAAAGGHEPKVIDFGVAKAIDRRLTELTISVERGMLIGKPEYMAPEQAEMNSLDIDTRADIYSLGVVLYELLSGSLPLDQDTLRSQAIDAMVNMIRFAERPAPATKLTAMKPDKAAHVANLRGADVRSLCRQLEGRLRHLPLKALREDRTKRYSSAAAFAADVRNYLGDADFAEAAAEPALASVVRRIRRNKLAYGLGAAALLMLALGAAGTAMGWVRARTALVSEQAAHREARLALDRVEAIKEFVSESLATADPYQGGGSQEATIAQAMLKAAQRIDGGQLADDPATEAELNETIAEVLEGNGHLTDAIPRYEAALSATQRLTGGESREVAQRLYYLALCLDRLGRSQEAHHKFEASLRIYRRHVQGDDADLATVQNNLALCLSHLGRGEEALPICQAALEMRRRLAGNQDDPDVANSLSNMAFCLDATGRASEALPYAQEALTMAERALGGDDPRLAMIHNNVGRYLDHLGRFIEALPHFETALGLWESKFKGDYAEKANTLANIAACLAHLDRLPEALKQAQRAAEMSARIPHESMSYRKKCDDVLADVQRRTAEKSQGTNRGG